MAVYKAAGIVPRTAQGKDDIKLRVIPYLFRLPSPLFKALLRRNLQGREASRTSMQEDFMFGRETEIQYLNGKVVDLGRQVGVPCPVNERMVALVERVTGAERTSATPSAMGPEEILKELGLSPQKGLFGSPVRLGLAVAVVCAIAIAATRARSDATSRL